MPVSALTVAVDKLYEPCQCCGGQRAILSLDKAIEKSLLKAAEKAFKKLYKKGDYSYRDLPEYTSLINKTHKSLSGALIGIVEDIPESMHAYLDNNIFLFSSLKTHAQLYSASKLLKDDEGKIVSFDNFKLEVAKINKAFNQTYLEAEYNFAVSSAQSASNWSNIAADTSLLQYRTAMDEKVRVAHMALHNITLPKDHSFWKEYYTPNGWNCRCTVVEVNDGTQITDSKDAMAKASKAMSDSEAKIFKFNPGKDKIIFPPNHPYTKVKDAEKIVEKLDIIKKNTK